MNQNFGTLVYDKYPKFFKFPSIYPRYVLICKIMLRLNFVMHFSQTLEKLKINVTKYQLSTAIITAKLLLLDKKKKIHLKEEKYILGQEPCPGLQLLFF